jgi:TonB family protein
MRRTAVLAAVLALAAAPALADPPPPDPALAFYPPAARAAGVEGQATIRCGRDAQMKLSGCVLVSETPAGQGFGPAALAMAAASQDNPKLNVADPALLKTSDFTVAFRLRPPSVDPDLSGMSHIITRPTLAHAPSPADMARYVPMDAAFVGGHVDLQCHVSVEGRLFECRVLEESPQHLHLGDAATLIAQDLYRLTPGLLDGQPDPYAEVEIPIDFGAPLTPPGPPSPPALIAFYPPAALAAGIGGSAELACERTERGVLANCKVALETPAGEGFGAAALALAAQAAPTCGQPTAKPGHPATYTFSFTAAPPRIQPNVLDPEWSLDRPQWLRQPSGEDFARYYPDAAERAGLSGRAVLNCKFDAKGRLGDCQVLAESPRGQNFADAALRLATLFQAAVQKTCNGHSVEGHQITIPIRFVAPQR